MNAPVTMHAMLREVTVRLDTWCEKEERRCATIRPPDFQLLYDSTVNWRKYQTAADRAARDAADLRRKWRRAMVTSFAMSMGSVIALGFFIVFIFLPL